MLFAVLILLGCWVYCILAITAAAKHPIRRRPVGVHPPVAISILKPLAGVDEGLEENLRSFFEQDYSDFEILFAVGDKSDGAVQVVRRLMHLYPAINSTLIITGEPPYPHAKVFSLQCMLERSRHELIVMSDSDIRVENDFCRNLAAEFADQRLGLVTCPYRAVSGKSIWSRLEAMGMNTDFHAGLFTATMMLGADFAVGPTIVARKHVLAAVGGMERVKDYLAEDFMLGKIASELGFVVRMSRHVVEHRIGSETMLQNFSHRLRWARSTRRSRPLGYIGQFFTYTLPVGFCCCLACPVFWPLLGITAILRFTAAWAVSERILGAGVPWVLLPLQDLLGFAVWIAGFFGNSIHWRGRCYILNPDGTFELAG